MFTLEDIDLSQDLDFIRENASQFLPEDVRPGGEVPGDGTTDPAADALEHPLDYLIVG